MTNFEKLSASPEALADFLTAITAANSPWDDDFHLAFCHQCGLEDCDHCPHEAERDNPAWWLAQQAEGTQDLSAKKISLSVDHAIRIAKIIATVQVERLPMITQLFHQASVDLEGLEELIENTALSAQGSLIDTGKFLAELTAGRELTEKGYLVPPEEFNRFCLARNLQPRRVKRHLYAAGRIIGTEDGGKIKYSVLVWIEGKPQRRIAVKPFGGRADG